MEQLLLIQDTEEQILKRKVKTLEEKYERLRKGQFAKISALNKMYLELKNEHEIWKSMICKDNLFSPSVKM